MAGSTERGAESTSVELFDRYTLPKVALAMILVASFLGTAVSTALAGQDALGHAAVKWGYFVALGILAGALLWKHGFVRAGDVEAGAPEYCDRMFERFRRIALACLAVVAAGGTVVVGTYRTTLADPTLVVVLGVALLGLAGSLGYRTTRPVAAGDDHRSPSGLAALGFALLALVVTGAIEVAIRGGDFAAVSVRSLHLLAFAVWIGGAVWNIFVAVPVGQDHPTTAVVRAAGQQLERFRWAVRFVIPTVVVTGLYQSIDVFGLRTAVYLETALGGAVLVKLGLIGLLAVIFKLCPMWRACSPIEGVCDLADLSDDAPAGDRADAPGPEVSTDD